MIKYSTGGINHLAGIFQTTGSVFPTSLLTALPCATLCAVIKALIDAGTLPALSADDSILKETQAWSGFSFLVGFLIVFRTSQAYSRFWDGCTATHQMRAEWFDACSSLVAFCQFSKADVAKTDHFKATLVRLFSMLHAAALADLEMMNQDSDDLSESKSMRFDIIDPMGLNLDTLKAIKASTSKVELIFSWIQFLIVENIETGVLSIPPPLLSRSFQEIANGMVAFHDAVKISYIPFPFPYAQTCDCLLVLHWLVVPFVVSQWVTSIVWAAVFVLIQVFILWSLNFIAVEIENPFGTDANDLDGSHMQIEMNRHLLLLLAPCTQGAPYLVDGATKINNVTQTRVPFQSLASALECVEGDNAMTAKRGAHFNRASCSATPVGTKVRMSLASIPGAARLSSAQVKRSPTAPEIGSFEPVAGATASRVTPAEAEDLRRHTSAGFAFEKKGTFTLQRGCTDLSLAAHDRQNGCIPATREQRMPFMRDDLNFSPRPQTPRGLQRDDNKDKTNASAGAEVDSAVPPEGVDPGVLDLDLALLEDPSEALDPCAPPGAFAPGPVDQDPARPQDAMNPPQADSTCLEGVATSAAAEGLAASARATDSHVREQATPQEANGPPPEDQPALPRPDPAPPDPGPQMQDALAVKPAADSGSLPGAERAAQDASPSSAGLLT